MVLIKDIAKECGVSTAAVSKALNGHSDISPTTRDRIMKVAEDLGYTGNPSARALKTKRTYNIGILFDDEMSSGISHEYFSLILESFRKAAEQRGYDITFINHTIAGKRTTYLRHSTYRGFDGVAVINANYENPEVAELIGSGIPVVTLDREFENCSSVASDNPAGMERLTEYILSMGHRRVAFIHGEMTDVTKARLEGFQRACESYGLSVPTEYICRGRYHDVVNCAEITLQLLALPERPTCIIFPDDYSFQGGREALQAAGLAVPEDISAAGYDGINIAKLMGLTTYEQDTEAIGGTAAEILIEKIENPTSPVVHREVRGRLLEGSSVKGVKLATALLVAR